MNSVQVLGQLQQLIDVLPTAPETEDARAIALDIIEELGDAILRERDEALGQP